jgi:predicted nucleic acid-binding protein
MMVLDTNVVSELMRAQPASQVLDWVNAQPSDQLCLCSVVVAELLYGVGRMPNGVRKSAMLSAVQSMVFEDFAGRVLSFDLDAAVAFAQMMMQREKMGRTIATADAQIAAICAAHGARLATRNIRDFASLDLQLINPWD